RFISKHSWPIYQELKCCRCRNYSHPPFLKCEENHSTCHACYSFRKICKTCGSGFHLEKMPFLKKVFECMNLHCENFRYGCRVIGTSKMVHQHQLDCQYPHIKCINSECKWSGKRCDIFDHYRKVHPSNIILDEPDSKRLVETKVKHGERRIINIMKQFGHTFRVTLVVSASTNTIKILSTNFEPFQYVDNYGSKIVFQKVDGDSWNRYDICRYLPNYGSYPPPQIVPCDSIAQFKPAQNSSMVFEHIVEMKTINYEYYSDSSSENGDDDEDIEQQIRGFSSLSLDSTKNKEKLEQLSL
ncbi:hypothetical protein HHI36_003003, partial [Cryptolaemus montrouzieri]